MSQAILKTVLTEQKQRTKEWRLKDSRCVSTSVKVLFSAQQSKQGRECVRWVWTRYKKWREASRQKRLKCSALLWASCTHPLPLTESWGNHHPPKMEGCCLDQLEIGLLGWQGKQTQVWAIFLFQRKHIFKAAHQETWPITCQGSKYNLSCLKFSLILCMCYDFQETNKKKENTPDFKENLFKSKTHLWSSKR